MQTSFPDLSTMKSYKKPPFLPGRPAQLLMTKWCVWLVAVSVLYDWRLLWCQVTGEAESAVIWGCFWISVCGSLEKTVVRWYSLWLCCTEHWVLWSTKHSRHSQSNLLISRSNIPSKWGSNFLGCLSTCSIDAFCVAMDRVIDIFMWLLGYCKLKKIRKLWWHHQWPEMKKKFRWVLSLCWILVTRCDDTAVAPVLMTALPVVLTRH